MIGVVGSFSYVLCLLAMAESLSLSRRVACAKFYILFIFISACFCSLLAAPPSSCASCIQFIIWNIYFVSSDRYHRHQMLMWIYFFALSHSLQCTYMFFFLLMSLCVCKFFCTQLLMPHQIAAKSIWISFLYFYLLLMIDQQNTLCITRTSNDRDSDNNY